MQGGCAIPAQYPCRCRWCCGDVAAPGRGEGRNRHAHSAAAQPPCLAVPAGRQPGEGGGWRRESATEGRQCCEARTPPAAKRSLVSRARLLSFLGVSGKRSGRRLGASFLPQAPPFRSQPENLSLLFSPTLKDSLFSSLFLSPGFQTSLRVGQPAGEGVPAGPEGGCGDQSSYHQQ